MLIHLAATSSLRLSSASSILITRAKEPTVEMLTICYNLNLLREQSIINVLWQHGRIRVLGLYLVEDEVGFVDWFGAVVWD